MPTIDTMTPAGSHMTFNGPITNIQVIFGGSPIINNYAGSSQSPQSSSSRYTSRPAHSTPDTLSSPLSSNPVVTSPAQRGSQPEVMFPNTQSYYQTVPSVRFPVPHHFEFSPSSTGSLSSLGSPLACLFDFPPQPSVQFSEQVESSECYSAVFPHVQTPPPMYVHPPTRNIHFQGQGQVDSHRDYRGDDYSADPYGPMLVVPCPSPHLQPFSLPPLRAGSYPMPEPETFNWPIDDRDNRDDESQGESYYATPSQNSNYWP